MTKSTLVTTSIADTSRRGSQVTSSRQTPIHRSPRNAERRLSDGLSFHNKLALVTGAGPGSTGAELVKKLLMGGATVIVKTSRAISRVHGFDRQIYRDFGARGYELFVLPFNQASMKDGKDLIDYVYNGSGLNLNIDILIPFAAMVQDGAEVDQLGPMSEVAQRLMLTICSVYRH